MLANSGLRTGSHRQEQQRNRCRKMVNKLGRWLRKVSVDCEAGLCEAAIRPPGTVLMAAPPVRCEMMDLRVTLLYSPHSTRTIYKIRRSTSGFERSL
eukprot:6212233-Pleurochrysis_carterae.AAC.3